jgi:hypothetical protein
MSPLAFVNSKAGSEAMFRPEMWHGTGSMRNGYDYTARFPVIRDSLLSLPVRSAIIDAELVVCDSCGKRDFKAHCSSAATLGRPGCWLIRERSGRATRSDVVMH